MQYGFGGPKWFGIGPALQLNSDFDLTVITKWRPTTAYIVATTVSYYYVVI